MTSAFLLTVSAAAACGGRSAPPSPTPITIPPLTETESLRDAASASGRLVGAAVQSSLLGDPRYSAALGRHFNYVTAEYEMR